jgi:hypothetical protein
MGPRVIRSFRRLSATNSGRLPDRIGNLKEMVLRANYG